MIAFVLSGGGSLGAIQAGMLEALFEAGVRPDAIVGTSIGAANAAFVAADPSLRRSRDLSMLWRSLTKKDVFPVGPIRTTRTFLRTGAFFTPEPLSRLIRQHVPYSAIEDAPIPLRIVATDFADGSEAIFDHGPVTQAVLASTALPAIFPPQRFLGRLYLDGGLVDHVPLAPAISLGADTVFVLSCGFPCPPRTDHRSARSVLAHSVGILLSQRIKVDSRQIPDRYPDLKIVSVPPVCTHAALRDLRRADTLIDRARDQTRRFLAGEPCHGCDHDDSTHTSPASVKEVLPLHSDLDVA